MFAAIRRASSLVSSLAADLRRASSLGSIFAVDSPGRVLPRAQNFMQGVYNYPQLVIEGCP
jgi:hypothetical protein